MPLPKGFKHSKETLKKISDASKRMWSDPSYVNKNTGLFKTGHIVTDEMKKKISIKNKGRSLTEQQKQQISEFHSGRSLTEEHKQKVSNSLKGKPKSEKHIKNAAVARRFVKVTDEWRKNLSISHIGKYPSEKTRMSHMETICGGFWYGNVKYGSPSYCEKFNEEFKERVRAYWGYKCFECGNPQNEIKLPVHHVHYDKKMCCNGSPKDVVPLCPSCHPKTNYNRDYWEDHFTELLYAYHPDGKCFFTKEEMKSYKSG